MRKPKTNSTASKRGRPATGHKLPGTEQRFHREFPGQEPRLVDHPGPDPSLNCAEVADEPSDKSIEHKFPPPKNHPTFKKIWMESIDNIAARENFKVGHLNSLEILCDLFVEYEDLTRFIRENGRSYKSTGRSGITWRFYPEVGQIKSVQAQIKDYTKLLGLLLKKDHSIESGGEKSEWD